MAASSSRSMSRGASAIPNHCCYSENSVETRFKSVSLGIGPKIGRSASTSLLITLCITLWTIR